MGGSVNGTPTNDVWSSGDGSDWMCAVASAEFAPRSSYSSVVFNDKIWVVGGFAAGANLLNDVWYSSNGSSWTQATAEAAFSKRYGHASLVYDNKMWVIGGMEGGGGKKNDVWYSSDGATWIKAIEKAEFSARAFHTCLAFDDGSGEKMWVIGGLATSYLSDVWYSSDGVNWTRATSNAGFNPRFAHRSVVYSNRMWTIGGRDNRKDVWSSPDGVNWTEATAEAAFSVRSDHGCVVFNNKMWVIGGASTGGTPKNDVWWSQ